MRLRTTFAMVILASFVLGCILGFLLVSGLSSPVGDYEKDPTAFCRLDEAGRKEVCPKTRIQKELKSGGTVVIYVCDESTIYLETRKLSQHSSQAIEGLLFSYRRDGTPVMKVCDSNDTVTYRMEIKQ